MFKFDDVKSLVICGGIFILVLFFAIFMGQFKGKTRCKHGKPEVEQLQEICKRATIELDYNDVAKATKGYWFFGKKKKQLWIEHKVLVKVSIDETKLEVSEEKGKWIIQVPKAEVLNVFCNPESFTENSFTIQKTLGHKVSAKEQNEAMASAIEDIKKDAENQSECLREAQRRAAKLLENELKQLQKNPESDFLFEVRLM